MRRLLRTGAFVFLVGSLGCGAPPVIDAGVDGAAPDAAAPDAAAPDAGVDASASTCDASVCGGVCVDMRSDPMNCGACGITCPSGSTCTASACVCSAAGRTLCGGAGCVDTMTDASHCGSCTVACTSQRSCVAGACMCAPLMLGAERRLTNDATASNHPRMAWNGTNAFVTWLDQGSSVSVYGLVLAPDGTPVGTPQGVFVGTQMNLLDVTWTGSAWAVAYAFGNTPSVTVITFGIDGMPVAGVTTVVPIASNTGLLDIRLGHTAAMGLFLVSSSQWVDLIAIGTPGSTPGPATHLATAGATPIDVATSAADEIGVLMAPLGANALTLQTVSAAGTVMPAHSIGLSMGASARDPSLTHDGMAWVAAWRQADGTTDSIGLARGTTTFTAFTVVSNAGSSSQNTSRRPVVVARGGQYAVVWGTRVDATMNAWSSIGERFDATASPSAMPMPLESAQTYVASPTILDQPMVGLSTSAGVLLGWSDSRQGAAEVYDALFTLPGCTP